MNGAPPCPDRGRDTRPVLLVLSHLRWDFVFQRPQHLMTRAARDYEVVFFEEPQEEDGAAPRLERFERAGVLVVRPVLPRGLSPEVSVARQRALLGALLGCTPTTRASVRFDRCPRGFQPLHAGSSAACGLRSMKRCRAHAGKPKKVSAGTQHSMFSARVCAL
jgi:hypothetical protein